MQILNKNDPQSTCESLLDLDAKIMYSSYLDVSGSILGEAIKNAIVVHNRLTVMVLPVSPGKESIVLATEIDTDLTRIVEKTKGLLASRVAASPTISRSAM
jgi:hypothetical protein